MGASGCSASALSLPPSPIKFTSEQSENARGPEQEGSKMLEVVRAAGVEGQFCFMFAALRIRSHPSIGSRTLNWGPASVMGPMLVQDVGCAMSNLLYC